jgi:uncharacterized protein (DUF4213/DUF364 family)
MNQKEIIDLLLAEVETLPEEPVKRITYGAHIVAVESRKMGLATWAAGKHPVSKKDLPAADKAVSVQELARLLYDDNPLKSSLGIAALNSLLPDPAPNDITDINAGDLIMDLGKGKNVVVIGHFPFVEKMRNSFKDFKVFEKKPQAGDLKAELMPEYLPTADLVAITATTISNQSLAAILSNCSAAATKLIIGPSTPLTPVMFKLGFKYVAGSLVKDENMVRMGIENGLAFKQVQGVRHVILQN